MPEPESLDYLYFSNLNLRCKQQDYTLYLAIFCAIFFVVCFFSILGWVIVGSKASSTLNGNYSVFNKVMAGLLALSVIYFIVDFVVLGRA
jgi:hypothetical protein